MSQLARGELAGKEKGWMTIEEVEAELCTNYLIFYRYEDGIVFVSKIFRGRLDYTHIPFGDLSVVMILTDGKRYGSIILIL